MSTAFVMDLVRVGPRSNATAGFRFLRPRRHALADLHPRGERPLEETPDQLRMINTMAAHFQGWL